MIHRFLFRIKSVFKDYRNNQSLPLFLVFRIIELKNEKNSSSRKIKELKGTGATKQRRDGEKKKKRRKVEGPCGNLTFTCTCQGIDTFISLRLDSRSSFNENVGRIYSLIM